MDFKKIIKKIYQIFQKKYFPTPRSELKRALSNCKSILDIGCGSNSPLQYISNLIYKVGIDTSEDSISKSKKKKIHNKYYELDARNIREVFKIKSFDCVIAIDFIEHLEKKEGLNLIKSMEEIARKKVVIFTPNGYVPQGISGNNVFQIHKSGWTANEMKKLGYNVIGLNGWKNLRGEKAKFKYKVNSIFTFLSVLSLLFIKNHPELAYHLFCVKDLNEAIKNQSDLIKK